MRFTFFILYVVCTCSAYAQNSWQEQTAIADSLELEFKSKEALSYRAKAIEMAKIARPDTLQFLMILQAINEGESSFIAPANFKAAYDTVENGVLKLEQLGAKPERLYQDFRRLYIYAHNYMRDMEAAGRYVDKSAQYHTKSNTIDSTTLLKTMHSAGVISRQLGKLDKALGHFKDAEDFFFKMYQPDSNTLGAIYLDVSYSHHMNFLNIPKKREAYILKSIETYEQMEDPNMDYFTMAYAQLADIERLRGNHESSLNYLNKGYELYLNNKEKAQASRMGALGVKKDMQYYHLLVQAYAVTDRKHKMLEALKQLEWYENNEDLDAKEYEFITLGYLFTGEYYLDNDPAQAISYLEKGLRTATSATEEDYTPDLKIALAQAQLALGNLAGSNRFLQEVAAYPTLIPAVRKQYLKVLVEHALRSKRKETVVTHINNLITSISGDRDVYNILANSYDGYVPGAVLTDAGYLQDIALKMAASTLPEIKDLSQKVFYIALRHFEHNMDNEPLSPDLNLLYRGILKGVFDAVIDCQVNPSSCEDESAVPAQILERTENIESRFLFENFYQNRQLSSVGSLDNLIEKEQRLRANLTFLKRKKHSLTVPSDSIIDKQIFEKEHQLSGVVRALKEKNNALYELARPDYDVEDLDTNEKLYLKYYILDNTLYRIAISKAGIKYTALGSADELVAAIKSILTSLTTIAVDDKTLQEEISHISETLLIGINIDKSVVIIPDGILHYLPFELLAAGTQKLVEKASVSYAINFTYLNANLYPRATNISNEVALFAPSYNSYMPSEVQLAVRGKAYDLSGAQAEISEIASLVNSKIYEGERATKQNFKEVAQGASVLHLSMHSFLNDQDAELNSLVFTDSNEDYELYISELYGLKLKASLAVLSACNTGVGGYQEGQGITSLSRAFTYAGVPATVSSLWSAPDLSTKKIMVAFYKYLKEGQSKSEALRNAKLEYLNSVTQTELKHPFYWAGFVLHGSDDPLHLKSASSWHWYVLGCTMIMGIVILIFWKRRKRRR